MSLNQGSQEELRLKVITDSFPEDERPCKGRCLILRYKRQNGSPQRQRKEEMEQDQSRISTKQRRAASFHHQHFYSTEHGDGDLVFSH